MIIHSRTSKSGQKPTANQLLTKPSYCGEPHEESPDSMTSTDIDCEDSGDVERFNSWSKLRAQEGRSSCKFMSRLSSICSVRARDSCQSNTRCQQGGQGPLRPTLSKAQVEPSQGEPMDNELAPESGISAGEFEIVEKLANKSHSNLSIGITQRCHMTDAFRC